MPYLRRALSIAILFAAFNLPIATSSGQAPAASSSAPSLRVAMPDASLAVDPALAADEQNVQLANLLYSGLVRLDASYHVVKEVAAGIQQSKDRKTYTFTLRKDARFSNGDPVVAEDFRYAIERSLNPALKSPSAPTYLLDIAGAYEYVRGKAKSVSGIRVSGSHTLRITTRWPVPYFLMELTYPTSFALDAKRLKSGPIDSSAWYSNPVGSGPYKLKSWAGDKVVLVPNKYYAGAKPALGHITISLAELPGAQLYQYLTHNVDVVNLPDYDRMVVHQAGVREQRMLAIDGIYMNFHSKPFDKRAVRRALTLSLQRATLVNDAMNGSATPFFGNVPRDEPGYYPALKPLGFQPGQAAAQLKKAGFPKGKKFPPLTLYYPQDAAVQRLATTVVAAWHKYLHITVGTEGLTLNTLFAMVQSNKLPLYLSGWSADYPDPHDWLSLQWETGALDNNVHYSNPHFDALVQTADVSWNYGARMRLYDQAQQTLVGDAAWIPLYIPHRVVYMRSTVQNLWVTGYGIIPRSGSWAQVQVKPSSSTTQHHLKTRHGT